MQWQLLAQTYAITVESRDYAPLHFQLKLIILSCVQGFGFGFRGFSGIQWDFRGRSRILEVLVGLYEMLEVLVGFSGILVGFRGFSGILEVLGFQVLMGFRRFQQDFRHLSISMFQCDIYYIRGFSGILVGFQRFSETRGFSKVLVRQLLAWISYKEQSSNMNKPWKLTLPYSNPGD